MQERGEFEYQERDTLLLLCALAIIAHTPRPPILVSSATFVSQRPHNYPRFSPLGRTAQMEDHYEAVVLKNSTPRSRQQAAGRTSQGRQKLPQTKGGGAAAKNPRVGAASSGSRKIGQTSTSAKEGRSRSNGKKKTGKGGAGGNKKAASIRVRGSRKKGNGKTKGPTNNAELVARRVYPSALAFMAERFPCEERQVKTERGA